MLWWLYTRPGSLIITTAPSQTLLGTVLFKEIRRAHARMLVRLPGRATESAIASPQTLMVDSTGHQVLGIATKGVERLSGQHNAELLVVVDEASGLDEEIWEALLSQNPAKMVVFGNPLRAEGHFYNLYRRADAEAQAGTIPDHERVNAIRISSLESPDINEARSHRGLADRTFINEIERTYGRDSLYWITHVEGRFPEGESLGRLLPDAWIDRLRSVVAECDRLRSAANYRPSRRLGVDLGEGTGRDRTVLVVTDQLGILHLEASDRVGIPEAALKINELAGKYGIRQDRIVYDAGGRGKDLPRYLEHHNITDAIGYRGSKSGGDRFANARSRVAWRLRQRLDPERPEPPKPVELPPDYKPSPFDPPPKPAVATIQPPFSLPVNSPWWSTLREEMAALRYEMKGAKIALEPKDDMSQRLGRSPDLVDALLMTFAVGD